MEQKKNVIAFPIWSLNVLSSLERNCAPWICRNVSLPDSEAQSLGFSKIICNQDLPPQTPPESHQSSTCSAPSAPTSAGSRFIRTINTVRRSKGCNWYRLVLSAGVCNSQPIRMGNAPAAARQIQDLTFTYSQLCLQGVTCLPSGVPWSVPSN